MNNDDADVHDHTLVARQIITLKHDGRRWESMNVWIRLLSLPLVWILTTTMLLRIARISMSCERKGVVL